jgi:hypothetical protein
MRNPAGPSPAGDHAPCVPTAALRIELLGISDNAGEHFDVGRGHFSACLTLGAACREDAWQIARADGIFVQRA